jgi:DNA-directed RNA polymerase specialized sigma24 family protein
VHATPELIEDACQSAWAILLSSQPRRGTSFAWLRVVAIHEAYRLSAIERRDLHLEDLARSDGWEAAIAGGASVDDVVEAREALRLLVQLPQGQREDLALLVAGFSYREIAEMTGRRTYTNVNKHLVRARAHIRRLERQTAQGASAPRLASS